MRCGSALPWRAFLDALRVLRNAAATLTCTIGRPAALRPAKRHPTVTDPMDTAAASMKSPLKPPTRLLLPRPISARRLAPLFVLMPLIFFGCRPTGPEETSIPADSAEVAFEMAGAGEAAILVPVHVNGEGPFPFVLDTGATITCLDEALADSLQLSDRPGVIGQGAGVQGSGRLRIVGVDSLRVGEVRATDLSACALSLESLQQVGFEPQGLLGLNFLRSFRVTLDFDRSIVRFEE